MKINKELLKGSNALLVLYVISKKDMYGYEIIQEIKTISKNAFDLKEGSLYPILHRYEEDGIITSFWENTDSLRKRKYYHITEAGLEELRKKLKEWRYYTEAVFEVIGGGIPDE